MHKSVVEIIITYVASTSNTYMFIGTYEYVCMYILQRTFLSHNGLKIKVPYLGYKKVEWKS